MLFKNDKSHMAQGLTMTAHSEGKLHVFIIKEFTVLDRQGEKQLMSLAHCFSSQRGSTLVHSV